MIKYLFSFLIVFGIISCKKYEEGPSFSLKSETKRLTGMWYLTRVNYGHWRQKEIPSFSYEFSKDGNVKRYYKGIIDNGGTWEFRNKEKDILIRKNWVNYYSFIDQNGNIKYVNDSLNGSNTESWGIYKLTSSELIVLSLQGGINFKFNFRKI